MKSDITEPWLKFSYSYGKKKNREYIHLQRYDFMY